MAGQMIRNNVFAFVLLANVCTFGIWALSDMKIEVPEATMVGQDVTLACYYDLEGSALYTIKWYRYDVEFYRYVPKESPPARHFNVPHIYVDKNRSNSTQVTLTNIDKETSGEYKCEVSADAPSFHTDIRETNLLVAEIQQMEEPVLRTNVQKLTSGATLLANCTTPASRPIMNVTWFVNDEKIHMNHNQYEVEINNVVAQYNSLNGLEMVISMMNLRVTNDLFQNGKMHLKCQANLFSIYNMSQEMEIQEDTPKLALVRSTNSSSNTGLSCTKLNKSNLMVLLLLYVHYISWLRIRSSF